MLPQIRSHELMDFKRCPRKWYWKWRRGLTPRKVSFSALDMGTWVHNAFAGWYGMGHKRNGSLAFLYMEIAYAAIRKARSEDAPEYEIEKAEEFAALGEEMLKAYQKHYKRDKDWYILGTEIPLTFRFQGAVYKLKPDGLFRDPDGDIWLNEIKTAAQIRTGHLSIDPQARGYGTLAERALIKAGYLKPNERIAGIMYNFLRKAMPDDRPVNAEGMALNKNGTVSAKQPAPVFQRVPVRLTSAAKRRTLTVLDRDVKRVTAMAEYVRKPEAVEPAFDPYIDLMHTPDKSCERFCQYYRMCVTLENGGDVRNMERDMYRVEDPYTYDEESTANDYTPGFD